MVRRLGMRSWDIPAKSHALTAHSGLLEVIEFAVRVSGFEPSFVSQRIRFLRALVRLGGVCVIKVVGA
jgi:hypothetical protein